MGNDRNIETREAEGMRTFYAIRDAHPIGYNHIPALCLLFEEITVWKPAFAAYAAAEASGSAYLSPKDFFSLFEQGLLKLSYDEGWDCRTFRTKLAENEVQHGTNPMFVEWVEPYDSKISSILSGPPLPHADRKKDDEWAMAQIQMGPSSNAYKAASRWLLPPDDPEYAPIPTATKDRINAKIKVLAAEGKASDEKIKEQVAIFQILRDACMLQRLLTATKTHSPIHRDFDETTLFGSVAPWSPYPRTPGPGSDIQEGLLLLCRQLREYSRLRGLEQIHAIREDTKIKRLIEQYKTEAHYNLQVTIPNALEEERKRFESFSRAAFVQYLGNFSKKLATVYLIFVMFTAFWEFTNSLADERRVLDVIRHLTLHDKVEALLVTLVTRPWLTAYLQGRFGGNEEMKDILRVLAVLYNGSTSLNVKGIKALQAIPVSIYR